jgi:chromosome segregation ATPase
MRVRFWMKAFMIVPFLSLLGFAAAARQQGSSQQQTGDPVADAARKARESKKDAPKPKKVYTDDDFKSAVPEPAAASGDKSGTAAAKAGDKAKTGDAPEEDPNGEKAWRKLFQAQRDKIAKAEREIDVLTRELEKAQIQYYPDPQKALTEQNNRADINEKNAKIEAKKKELEQLKQGLDDLEDQLRKSGGDPGWAR